MTHKIKITENYILIMNESKINDWDWIQRNDEQPILVTPYFFWDFKDRYRKIIAHLPLNDSLVLNGVDLLPPVNCDEPGLEVRKWLKNKNHLYYQYWDSNSFKEGYNICKEKYKFTEDDIRRAIMFGHRQHYMLGHVNIQEENEFIESLTKSNTPVGFDCEMEEELGENGITYGYEKKTKNPDGKIVWVGKWVY